MRTRIPSADDQLMEALCRLTLPSGEPSRAMRDKAIQLYAACVCPRMYVAILDELIASPLVVEQDPTAPDSLRARRAALLADPHATEMIQSLVDLLECLIRMRDRDEYVSDRDDIDSVVASIGAQSLSALCERVTAGRVAGRVLAIRAISMLYPYLELDAQPEVVSALTFAAGVKPARSRVTAAVAAAQKAIRSANATASGQAAVTTETPYDQLTETGCQLTLASYVPDCTSRDWVIRHVAASTSPRRLAAYLVRLARLERVAEPASDVAERRQAYRAALLADPDSTGPIESFLQHLDCLISMRDRDEYASDRDDIDSVVASIGAESVSDLCRQVTVGRVAGSVLAIRALSMLFPYLDEIAQSCTVSALTFAAGVKPARSRVTAAVAAARETIRAAVPSVSAGKEVVTAEPT